MILKKELSPQNGCYTPLLCSHLDTSLLASSAGYNRSALLSSGRNLSVLVYRVHHVL